MKVLEPKMLECIKKLVNKFTGISKIVFHFLIMGYLV